MREEIKTYCLLLLNTVPLEIYVILLVVFCLGSLLLIGLRGARNIYRDIAGLLLLEYIIFIYCSTVFFRAFNAESKYDFTPLWSYRAIIEGSEPKLLLENIMNVVTFIPVGVLAGVAFRGINWIRALVLGMGLSIVIEVLQLVFRKGFSELDDVMHNSFGCLIGFGIHCMLSRGFIKG